MDFILAIDQGTTNSRAIIFDKAGKLIAHHEIALTQFYPQAGWVEQDPEEMFLNTVTCCREVLKKAQLTSSAIAAIGITNQRETTIVWDKNSGKPIYPALVWQDRRTADLCKQLSAMEKSISEKTGLVLDPYFSATKVMWLLEKVADARQRAEQGDLIFGTVDSYLLWKLTKGKVHATDVTNASRTMLFNIHTQQWDQELLKKFNIPAAMLPEVYDNAADFGLVNAEFLGKEIPIAAMVGDQQAATVGQACFSAGMIKATYGTGAFLLLNTGSTVIQSQNRLLATVTYRLDGKVCYGLEGSIFSAGTTIKWLRDKLKLIKTADESEFLAERITSTDGVYLVPAFTGLGAPWWLPHARAMITGLSSDSGAEQIVRAGLECVAYQTKDLLQAMIADYDSALDVLRVDGGMTVNNWLLQFIADILDLQVHRPSCVETTSLGAAYLAGLQIGWYQSLDEISELWQMQRSFQPCMAADQRERLYAGWKLAIQRSVPTNLLVDCGMN